MRSAIPALFVAALLVTAVGGFPRAAGASPFAPQQTADQPLRLAQGGGPNMFALLQDIQRLRQQVRQLRGQIQMLKHRIQRNSKSRQQMYKRLDKRLTALEQGGGSKASEQKAKQAYMAAFDKLRKGQYDAAIGQLEVFVKKYPDSTYSDNAWYWLGQARYVDGDLDGALDALQTLVKKSPKSDKVPSALLRIGVIQQTQGNSNQARSTFERILREYADKGVADKARAHLKDLGS